MIRPKKAKVLAWKGRTGMIFARAVRGVKPRYYFRSALRKMGAEQRKIQEAGYNYVKKQLQF